MGKLTSIPVVDTRERPNYIVLASPENNRTFSEDTRDYAGMLTLASTTDAGIGHLPTITDVSGLEYLQGGDVVLMLPSGTVNVLYRKASPHNTVLATERCNSFCLMCSQPPRDVDDSYRVTEILRLIELIDDDCKELGISGGEPTLLGDDFLNIVRKARDSLPSTALHVLTNGRLFTDRAFAQRLGEIAHPDLMLGIPLYSDIDTTHDHVVQAKGAFDETVLGLYNLAEQGVRVEIRIVVHALTCDRLPQLAEFIYRNLPFASHVAIMGLEMFGFVHQNLPVLWVDPFDYRPQLSEAVKTLAVRGMNVSIYNHQLCTLPQSVWPFTRKSISDWKNVYLKPCEDCGVRGLCGGFFQSATKKHSAHIAPLDPIEPNQFRRLQEYVGA